jgi:hypothetical protein
MRGALLFPLFFRNVLYILGNVDDSVRPPSEQRGKSDGSDPVFQSVEQPTSARKMPTIKRGDRYKIYHGEYGKTQI